MRYCLIFIAILSLHATLIAQNFEWVNIGGGNYLDNGSDVVVDENHDVIIAGSCVDTSQFGSTILPGYGWYDGFISKYDSSGAFLWARGFGGKNHDHAHSVATDQNNNVYVTGSYSNSAIYFTSNDSLQITSSTATNIFLAKYDPSGNLLWCKSGASSWAVSTSLWVDQNGDVFIGGNYLHTLSFSGSSVTEANHNLFLAKISSSGITKWIKSGITGSGSNINALATDGLGNVYATGNYSRGPGLQFGNVSVSSNTENGLGIFSAKFDSSGTALWISTEGNNIIMGGDRNDIEAGNGILADIDGNVYVAGNMVESYDWVANYSEHSAFIVKYDSEGNKIWMEDFGIAESLSFRDIAMDPEGNLNIVGNYTTAISLGFNTLPQAMDADILFAKFDSSGYCLSAFSVNRLINGTPVYNGNHDSGNSLAIDPTTGSVYSCGTMDYDLTWGNLSVVGREVSSVYLAKFGNFPVGISDVNIETNEVLMYPNPSNGIIHFEGDKSTPLRIIVLDINGREVINHINTEAHSSIDISSLPKGVYILQLENSHGDFMNERIVKF